MHDRSFIQWFRLVVVHPMFVAHNTSKNATIFLVKLQQVAKISFVATCHLQICCNLLKQLAANLWITSCDHSTCNKFVDNSQTMRTHADIGLLIKRLLQDVNRFIASCLSNLVIHRFVASYFNKLQQVCKRHWKCCYSLRVFGCVCSEQCTNLAISNFDLSIETENLSPQLERGHQGLV